MPRHQPSVTASPDDLATLHQWSASRTIEARLAERARIVLRCINGDRAIDIAQDLRIRPNTVISWRQRFQSEGIRGLYDRPRSGKPATYADDFRRQVLSTLELSPPTGQATWDGAAVAAHLKASDDAVWRVLRKEGISLQRQRSWCVSTDPQFAEKAADVVGLYLSPPTDAIVLSVDEKPSIQARECATGYVQTSDGTIVRGFKSTYKRHGTLNLFAALEVATGAVHTKTTARKRRVEFLEFMDEVVGDLDLPPEREIHVILDNYGIHKRNDDWLALHPNITFHYTPTSASWLNMVEIWFGIFTRKALRGASFGSLDDLTKAIQAFVNNYGPTAKPFIWRKREVKGTQLKNTIANLRN